jgi:uncharacterized membrane-anchored protein YjiN (DUF445 family)
MKFILKEGLVYVVENDGLYNNNIEAEVEAPGLEEFAVEYKVNDSEYKKVENHKVAIPKEFLKATSVKLVFRAIKQKEIKYFESDAIPLTQAVVFGGTIDTYYPKIIRQVLHNMEQVNEAMQVLKDFAERKADETKFDLKQTMLELVDTFEEITKKGSLF